MTGSNTNEFTAILSAISGVRKDVAQLREEVREDVGQLRQDMRSDVRALHERIESMSKATSDKLADKVDDNYCVNKCRPNLVDKRFFGGFGAALIVITSAIAIIGRFWP